MKSALSLQNLSLLLFSAQGKRGDGEKLTAPSAQEQYPMAVLIVAINVSEIEAGIYRYNPSDHSIQLIAEGKFAQTLSEAAIGDQPWVDEAAAIIVLAADIEPMKNISPHKRHETSAVKDMFIHYCPEEKSNKFNCLSLSDSSGLYCEFISS